MTIIIVDLDANKNDLAAFNENKVVIYLQIIMILVFFLINLFMGICLSL